MVYDLNVPWSPTTSPPNLQRTLTFLESLNYTTLSLNHIQTSPIPNQILNPLPEAKSFTLLPKTTLLHRCTLLISDPTQNHRLPSLATHYHILALRPTTEKAFLATCLTLSEHSLISLDLTIRYPFHFRPKPLMTAIHRGIHIEICYSQAIYDDPGKRRNFISNVMSIVRATKGRGLVISSEAKDALGIRGVSDVVNLLGVWGLTRERAVEGFRDNPRGVVVNEGMKRRGFRGVVDVVFGGEVGEPASSKELMKEKSVRTPAAKNGKGIGKRNVEDDTTQQSTPQLSKRAMKRARVAASQAERVSSPAGTPSRDSNLESDSNMSGIIKESNR